MTLSTSDLDEVGGQWTHPRSRIARHSLRRDPATRAEPGRVDRVTVASTIADTV